MCSVSVGGKFETFKQLHSFTLHSEAQLTQLTEKIAAQNGDSNWFSVKIWIFGTEGFHSSIGPENLIQFVAPANLFKRFLANSSNFFGMRYILQQQRANLPHHIGVGHF